jgi:hypothetical protein
MVFLLMFKYGKRVVQIEKWTGGGKSTLVLKWFGFSAGVLYPRRFATRVLTVPGYRQTTETISFPLSCSTVKYYGYRVLQYESRVKFSASPYRR